jgi:hypothetical protein
MPSIYRAAATERLTPVNKPVRRSALLEGVGAPFTAVHEPPAKKYGQ